MYRGDRALELVPSTHPHYLVWFENTQGSVRSASQSILSRLECTLCINKGHLLECTLTVAHMKF